MIETPETAGKFPAPLRLLHWLMASLIIGVAGDRYPDG